MKKLSIALILATMIATICVAGVELANAERSELLMKLMGFISLIIFNVYAIAATLRYNDK